MMLREVVQRCHYGVETVLVSSWSSVIVDTLADGDEMMRGIYGLIYGVPR